MKNKMSTHPCEEHSKGVYYILNTVNNKRYIGSTKNFKDRKNKHFRDLKNNRHHNTHLQNAWNKYGKNAFKFVVLEQTTKLNIREQYYLDKYKTYDKNIGYNICKTAQNKKYKKDRKSPSGELHSQSKLTIIDVRNIRERSQKETITQISKDYPVSKGCIRKIVLNQTWVDKDYTPNYYKNPNRLNINIVKQIRSEYLKPNNTFKTLAKKFKIADTTVQSIIENRIYKDKKYKYIRQPHPKTKINIEIAREIRKQRKQNNLTYAKLSKKFKLNPSTIGNIINHKIWKEAQKIH